MTAPLLNPAFKWEPAAHHLTPQGLDDFRSRMKARIAAAQAKPQQCVTPIRKRK